MRRVNTGAETFACVATEGVKGFGAVLSAASAVALIPKNTHAHNESLIDFNIGFPSILISFK